MAYDFKTEGWRYDINAFSRWKMMFSRLEHLEGAFWNDQRERIRGYMKAIQQRWPQYIKDHEIP